MPLDPELLDLTRSLNADVTIRPAGEADAEAYVGLMNKHYRRQKSLPYFNWQFVDSPYPSTLIMAWNNQEAIACFGVHIWTLSNGWPCGFTVDLLIDEAYRNRGLHLLLEEDVSQFASHHEAVALAALPNADGRKDHLGMPDWKHIGDCNTLCYEKGKKQNERTTQAETLSSGTIFFKRDEAFRAWRFDDNPAYTYDTLRGADKALAVLKVFQDPQTGERFGDIVELSTSSDDPDAARDLIRQCLVWFHDKDVKSVTTWALPHTSAYPLLTEAGFLQSEQVRHFCVKILRDEARELEAITSWELVESDSEVY